MGQDDKILPLLIEQQRQDIAGRSPALCIVLVYHSYWAVALKPVPEVLSCWSPALSAVIRDTGLFVPLLAAVGVASLVSEYAEGILSQNLEAALSNLYLKEKLLFWGAGGSSPGPLAAAAAVSALPAASSQPAAGAGGVAASAGASAGGTTGTAAASSTSTGSLATMVQQKTVEAVIATPARLYVRHTLPLGQAKEALTARGSAAAVVVDDNFTPMGIVYLDDIEAELVKQELLMEPDTNFDRPQS
jgi:hypothetical protein